MLSLREGPPAETCAYKERLRAFMNVDATAVGFGARVAATGVEASQTPGEHGLAVVRGLHLDDTLWLVRRRGTDVWAQVEDVQVITVHGLWLLLWHLDDGATNPNAVVVVDHHGPAVDVLGIVACCDAQVVHRRRHGALNHIADVHPGVFRVEVRVPVMATDGGSIRAGRALVDVDTTAVGRSACGLIASGVEALSEQPAERLRSIIRLDLSSSNVLQLALDRDDLLLSTETADTRGSGYMHLHSAQTSSQESERLDTTGCQREVTTVLGVLLEDRGGGRLDDATCNLSAFLVMDHHSATQHIVISETRLHFLG